MLSNCRSLTAAIVFLILTLISGCGKKAPLVPPQMLVPVAISDLHYILDENGVTLHWTYPEKMENGAELTAIESFEVFRAEVRAEEYCDGCPIRFDRLAEVDGGLLPTSGERRTAV
ncbi:MAG: hypothetical protein JRF02_08615, partial [Deltaproteobacteria bacterium]|nr:hypothetical protein [Deltaproteobacteria bacterium]